MNKISKIRFSKKHLFLLTLILILAFFLRIIGLNWDQGQHLHPDERFLTMVLTEIKIPSTFKEYLNPGISSLNPYNHDFSFFVYGAFPINLVRFLAENFNLIGYDQIYLVGRFVAVFLDTSIILLIYLISVKVFSIQVGLVAAFFYSISVLPIQLSHFYTVDPFLNFFLVLSFYLLVLLKKQSKTILKVFLLSLFFGLSLACKISAIYFLPVIFIFFVYYFIKKPSYFFLYGLIFTTFTLIFFRLNQPQVFQNGNFLNWNLNSQFVNNLLELKSYSKNQGYPPSIQWLKTTPILYPVKNIILWGLGLPLGLIFVFSIIYTFYFLIKKHFKGQIFLSAILFWVMFLIIFQGSQSVTTMRYFLPIYPFIAILSAVFVNYLKNNISLFQNKKIIVLMMFIFLVYPLFFISIYFKDHSRVIASNWIYQNIAVGSTLATEYWDDALPLSIGSSNYSVYQSEEIHVADKDSEEKMSIINNQLKNSNYIILSSNRFYLPIPKNSDFFPLTAKYYKSLFDGSLGFKKIAEFSSPPCFPPIGKPLFCLNDTNSEEAFTVYDHPKVLIFKKIN